MRLPFQAGRTEPPSGRTTRMRRIGRVNRVVGAYRDSSDDVRKLFEAAQEVARESVEIALRVADERDLSPHDVIRTAFMMLQGLSLTRPLPRPPSPEAPPTDSPRGPGVQTD
jgi:hypothetical protein